MTYQELKKNLYRARSKQAERAFDGLHHIHRG